MKKSRIRNQFLEELKKIPIVAVACEKTSISRTSVYRWRNDQKFREEMDKAIEEGEALINDLTESQLFTLIQEKNWSAVSFYLRHRNPKYKEKVEITTKIERSEEMNEEQQLTAKEALRLASLITENIINKNKKNE